MAEKGIIFSAAMVRALLAGTKSQTRRLLKYQPEAAIMEQSAGRAAVMALRVPYGRGDRLYVREAFSYDTLDVDRDGTLPPWYWADGNIADAGQGSGNFTKPKPSIHMPRWASRLWLSVTDVRVQRVQEISRSDEVAEGVTTPGGFMALWNSLHTKPGERWEDNPWIVAITFDVHHGNIDTASSDAPESAGARATEPSERGQP